MRTRRAGTTPALEGAEQLHACSTPPAVKPRSRCGHRSARRRRGVQLPRCGAQCFSPSPDEAAIDADLEWIARTSDAESVHVACIPECCRRSGVSAAVAPNRGRAAVLFVLGSVAALLSPQLAMVGLAQPHAGRPRHRARVRRPGSHAPAHDHQRARAGHRCGESRRRAAGGSGITLPAVRHRARPRLSAPTHAALARAHPRAGRAGVRVPAAYARRSREHFPRRNRIISGSLARHAGGRSGARTAARSSPRARAGAGPRGVCHSRLDPQSALARLSSVDPRRRQARREAPQTCCPKC